MTELPSPTVRIDGDRLVLVLPTKRLSLTDAQKLTRSLQRHMAIMRRDFRQGKKVVR